MGIERMIQSRPGLNRVARFGTPETGSAGMFALLSFKRSGQSCRDFQRAIRSAEPALR